MTAEEARIKAQENLELSFRDDLIKAMEFINEAVSKGEFKCQIPFYVNDNLRKHLREKLDYVIGSIQHIGDLGPTKLTISW